MNQHNGNGQWPETSLGQNNFQEPNGVNPHTHPGVSDPVAATAVVEDDTLAPLAEKPAERHTNFSEENVFKDPTKWSERQVPIVILPCTEKDLARLNEGIKSGSVSETTEGLEWLYWFTSGLESKLNADFGKHAFGDPERLFVKRVKSEMGPSIGAKNIGVDNTSEVLTTASAKHMLRSIIGSGTTRRWPLYRSGFWMTITTPLEEDLLALDDMIAEEKTALGAKTAGLAFSVSMSYIFKHVINLILTSLVTTNIEDPEFNKNDVFSYVRMVDVWGLVGFYASLIYPNGYAARIPCTADNECTNTDAVYIDILDILRVDRSQLTEEQVEWMANPATKRTLKEIEAYQTKYNVSSSSDITLEDETINAGTITYTIPTVDEYIQSSESWINEIADKVEATISDKTSLRRKEALLEEHFRLSICREYSHCITSITLPSRDLGDGNVRGERLIEDRISINTLLAEYSTNPTFYKQIIGAINGFLDRKTITHVGIPPHTCTKCHCSTSTVTEPGKPVTLIALDPMTTFFTVRNQKLQRSMLKKAQG